MVVHLVYTSFFLGRDFLEFAFWLTGLPWWSSGVQTLEPMTGCEQVVRSNHQASVRSISTPGNTNQKKLQQHAETKPTACYTMLHLPSHRIYSFVSGTAVHLFVIIPYNTLKNLLN